MLKINWDLFNIKNSDKENAFETLCLMIFCNQYNVKDYISADFNQAGLETEPIEYKGRWYGFQSKYSSDGIKYQKVYDSIDKATRLYPNLDEIIVFYNSNSKPNSSESGKRIVKMAKDRNVEIKWFGLTAFKLALDKKKNLPLAQFFFGTGHELTYLESVLNKDDKNLLADNKLIELPVVSDKITYLTYEQVKDSINKTKNKVVLVTGMPGTGKSIYMKKIFYMYAGMNLGYKEQMEYLLRHGVIPMFINLKSALGMSLEEVIRYRKADYQLLDSDFKFVYLLDGLDEVPMDKVGDIVSCIKTLQDNNKTEKIIISSRKMSSNRSLFKASIEVIVEYEIKELDIEYINKYFQKYGNEVKKDRLNYFVKNNKSLLKDIKDILMVKIFYDTVLLLDDESTVMDVIERKISHLIKKDKINELALPWPKEEKIIEINKEISYEMQKKHFAVETMNGIYQVLEKMYNKMDYQQQNEVVEYLSNAFFTDSSSIEEKAFAYQHKRYQEYFLCKKLKDLYDEDMQVLRESGVLADKEFFENMFLRYLENYYSKSHDIVGAAEISLLNTYLGHNNSWGADRPYYEGMDSFTKAVAAQSEVNLSKILNDEELPVATEIMLDVLKVEQLLINRQEEHISMIPDRLEELIKFGLRNIVEFWIQGKENVSKQIIDNINQIGQIIKENYKSERKHFNNAFVMEKYSYYFILIVINNVSIKEVFDDIEERQPKSKKVLGSEYEKAIKEVIDILFSYRYADFVAHIKELTNEQFIILMNTLLGPKYLESLSDVKLKKEVTDYLQNIIVNANDAVVIAWAKFYDIVITEQQKSILLEKYKELNKERTIDLFTFHDNHNLWAFISNMYTEPDKDYMEVDSRWLYYVLYRDYMKYVINSISAEEIAINFCEMAERCLFNKNLSLTYYIMDIWVQIFISSKISKPQKETIVEYILKRDDKFFSILSLLVGLKDHHDVESDTLVEKLMPLFDEKKYRERFDTFFDMTDNADYKFRIAYLKAGIDNSESYADIIKGLSESVLRHGWRKDTLVDSKLVGAFEIMANKAYISQSEIIEAAQILINMMLILNHITDERWRGDELGIVLGILDKTNMDKASKALDVIIQENAHSNDMLYNHLKTKIIRGCAIDEIVDKIMCFDDNEVSGRSVIYTLGIYLHLYYSHWYIEEQVWIKDRIHAIMHRNTFMFTDELETETYELLQRFSMENNLECSINEKNSYVPVAEVANDNTKAFINKLKKCKSKQALDSLYEQLNDYKSKIMIDSAETWKLLVDKTLDVFGDYSRILKYFEENDYPHTDFYSRNSKYMYMGLGYVIKSDIDKKQLYNYIIKKGGHDGFVQLINSYAFIGDKEMCRKLFYRFIDICKLLVVM